MLLAGPHLAGRHPAIPHRPPICLVGAAHLLVPPIQPMQGPMQGLEPPMALQPPWGRGALGLHSLILTRSRPLSIRLGLLRLLASK